MFPVCLITFNTEGEQEQEVVVPKSEATSFLQNLMESYNPQSIEVR